MTHPTPPFTDTWAWVTAVGREADRNTLAVDDRETRGNWTSDQSDRYSLRRRTVLNPDRSHSSVHTSPLRWFFLSFSSHPVAETQTIENRQEPIWFDDFLLKLFLYVTVPPVTQQTRHPSGEDPTPDQFGPSPESLLWPRGRSHQPGGEAGGRAHRQEGQLKIDTNPWEFWNKK